MIISKLKKEITSSDYIFKDVVVCGKKVNLIFNEVLTDGGSINEFLYYLLTKVSKSDLKKFNFKININQYFFIKNKVILLSYNWFETNYIKKDLSRIIELTLNTIKERT